MQFKLTAAFFAAAISVVGIATSVALANPAAPRAAQACTTVFFPDNCPSDMPNACNGAGSITLCCDDK
ncbi:hypothetical protein V5O48_001939 [Marasmius crinis-equi]|uniref:Uncharacterized protein n=1 Tax=Marasmius crinis-equi TaxID=585013 RepID=A0ABR3FX04_9AGAR